MTDETKPDGEPADTLIVPAAPTWGWAVALGKATMTNAGTAEVLIEQVLRTAPRQPRSITDRVAACLDACTGIPTETLKGARFVPADDETPIFELVREGGAA